MNEHLNKNSVAAAFKLVIEELDKANQGIAKKIAEASMNADYEKVHVLGDRGKSLKAFSTRVNALRQEWINGIDIPAGFPNKPQPKFIPKSAVASPTKLRVLFPDGERIERDFATDTFVETIQKIGIDKVRELGIRVYGKLLIDSHHRENTQQKRVNGWYICTHSSTAGKKTFLDKIAQQLGIRLKVEIISKDKSALF